MKKGGRVEEEEFTRSFLYIFLSVLKKEVYETFLVMITWRKYLFPYRTQKSSSNVPKIFAGYPAEKIGCRQIINSPLAQLVERSAVEQGESLRS